MKIMTISLLLTVCLSAYGQSNKDTLASVNSSIRMMQNEKKLTIGGYAQVDYNQPIESGKIINGNLDVHRMVLMVGYKFNNRIQFITEIEIEHVKEVFVEQAFLNYRVNQWLNLRGGLMLIPMGIVNEYHEPPTFNGVERPAVDYYIVPTTWREIGIGIAGRISKATLQYQLYIVNGFLGYDGNGKLNATNGLRKGRQKGAKAISATPNITGKLEYYGVPGLNIGVSGYFGLTQTTLKNNLTTSDDLAVSQADSSVVSVSMFGLDGRYTIKGIFLRGQFNYVLFDNSAAYNTFTGQDLGSSMIGFYAEVAYNVFHECRNLKSQLLPFIRYENYNTQNSVEGSLKQNNIYHREEIIAGIGWKPVNGVAIKADFRFVRPKTADKFSIVFNAGIGLWF